MKKNITIICLNDFLRKETAKDLAKLKKMHYLDIDELIDFELISRKQVSLKCGDEFLTKLEKECVERVAEYSDCVYSISADLYMANDNKYYLEDTDVVYLATEMHTINLNNIKDKEQKNRIMQDMDVFQNVNEYLQKTIPNVIKNADIKTSFQLVNEIVSVIDNKK